MSHDVSRQRGPRIGLMARALLVVLVQALVLQPAAFAATWNIAQQPLFTVNAVYPNVVFMMDDSWSMGEYRLPAPAFFSVNGRWPTGTNVTVRYGAGTRSVLAQDEFTLRSSIHNPLAYDPAITYTPWNDNDKTQAAQGTRPTRAQNFPPADIGGIGTTANANRLTERDMRFRGFTNGTANSPRSWVTTSRGTVGGNGTYASGSPAADRWPWAGGAKRWEQPLTPNGTAIYMPFPNDGPQAADLFTNPPAVCNAQPPCLVWNTKDEQVCESFAQVPDGYTNVCSLYQDVPVYQNVCVDWTKVPNGFKNGACLKTQQQQTGWKNGSCIKTEKKDIFEKQCTIETVVDPTSETGYRQVQVCVDVKIGEQDVCVQWEQLPVYTDVCVQWEQIQQYKDECVKYENQQTGTTKQCVSWTPVPKYKDVCQSYKTVTVNTTCKTYDPDWVCPPQNITSDNLTPARYYRYEGPVPASDDDLAVPGNYRLVEVDRAVVAAFPVPVDPRTGLARVRKDCALGTSCSRVEEMQNYANWFTYYRHRLFAALAVTSQAAADLKGDLSALRLGYGRINYFHNGPDPWDPYGPRLDSATFAELDADPAAPNHPGGMVRGVRNFNDTAGNVARQQFFDWVFSLNWVGSTPNREAVDSIGRYYQRDSLYGPWSDNPGVGGGRAGGQQLSCRRSFAILATDGEWTAIPENPPVPPAQPLITTRSPDPVGVGGGTVTASVATTGPTITGSGLYDGQTYAYDPGAELQISTNNGGVTQTLTDVALYWWNRDLRPDMPNAVQKRPEYPSDSFWQNVTTYVVGYGLNASMNTAATRQQVAAGGPVNWPVVDTSASLITGGERVNDTMRAALATRGDFYSANDPDMMRGSIRGVFRAIAQQAFSGTGLGATSSQLTIDATLYRASFTTQVWTGNLAAYDAKALVAAAEAQTAEPAPLWVASFPQWDQRKLFTSSGINDPKAFNDFATLSADQKVALGSADVMDYIRGKQVGVEADKPDGTGSTLGFRSRSTILGSIVSSSPRYSKAPDFGYHVKPAAHGGGNTYKNYVLTNTSSRVPAIYVGANAGVFHAFDARTTGNPGRELFGYVPRSTYAHMAELTSVDYSHRYFVDGPVVEGDVYTGGAWKTVVMGSSGAGVPGLFALNVTHPESFGAGNVMWDITQDDEPDLGRVTGYGFIGSVKDGSGIRWVALVPNGYASANNRAVLLVIDIATGSVVRKIDTCKRKNGTSIGVADQDGRCDAAQINGLANVSVSFDAQRNIVGAFAGDYQGNLWRFDLSATDPADWKIDTEDPADMSGNTPIPLFTARSGTNRTGDRQPITAAPRAATHPYGGTYVVFGTGKFFEYPDQTSTDVQSMYGLWLKPGDKQPISATDLQAFDWSEATVNGVVQRTITNTSGFSWRTKRGWFVDLMKGTPGGERVIADPIIERGMLTITSFQPTSAGDPCAGGGASFFYSIPMDAGVEIRGIRINGLVSPPLGLSEEAPVSGTRSTVLNRADAKAALANQNEVRINSEASQQTNQSMICRVIFSNVNVKVDALTLARCGAQYPVRTSRPIR